MVSFWSLKWIQISTIANGAWRCGIETASTRRRRGEKRTWFLTLPVEISMAFVPKMVLDTKCRNICGTENWSSRALSDVPRDLVWCALGKSWLLHSLLKVTVYILGTEMRELFVFLRRAEVWSLFFWLVTWRTTQSCQVDILLLFPSHKFYGELGVSLIMKAHCNPWKTLATLLFAAASYYLEERGGQSALSLSWEILFNGSQVIHCLKLTSSIFCLCFSESAVSKPDKNWTFSLPKSLSRVQISKELWGMQSCGNTGWWREGGGKLGEPIRPLCPGTWCQLDFEELRAWQHPGIPKTKREGCITISAFPVWLHSHLAASCPSS